MARIMAVVSDLHCGSTVGLHPESATALDDGGSYHPTPAQRWLWSKWLAFWADVKKAAKGHELTILLNGDVTDGPEHHGTVQAVSRHPLVQSDIAMRCLEVPMELKPKHVIMVRGTEAHVGPSGSSEEGIAKALASRGLPILRTPTGQYSWWHFVGDLGPACRVSATHHGLVGSRSWTRNSGANSLAAMIFFEHSKRGERAPDLAIRSHRHIVADSGPDAAPTRVIQTGCFQLSNSFAFKVAAESLADIGGLIVRATDTEWSAEKRLYRPDPAPVVTL